ncbi:hypothetical protein SALBM135S_05649 [Streptomyces alboniger]
MTHVGIGADVVWAGRVPPPRRGITGEVDGDSQHLLGLHQVDAEGALGSKSGIERSGRSTDADPTAR